MPNWANVNHINDWTDKDVERHWDNIASIYVEENNKVKTAHDQRFREMMNHIDLPVEPVVLNISSRDSEASDYIIKANKKASVVNAEISLKLIEVARKFRPNTEQVKIDTYSELPFEDERFNRIVSLETLEHAHHPLRFLTELHRVSQQGAKMVLSCPPQTSEIPYRLFTFLFGGHGEGPHRFLSSTEVKEMLKKTNWRLLFHKATVLIPVGPESVQRMGEKILAWCSGTFISELGIRQFYVCEKA